MANTYTLINSNTVGSGGAASVTFSSIPATYTDLVLRISARGDDNGATYDGFSLTINSDNASNYSSVRLTGSGSAATSALTTNQTTETWTYISNGSTSTTNTFGNTEYYFPNYTSTSNKVISLFGVSETNATAAYMSTFAGLYRGTSGITRLSFTPYGSTNFVTGSSFYLYGIKNS